MFKKYGLNSYYRSHFRIHNLHYYLNPIKVIKPVQLGLKMPGHSMTAAQWFVFGF